MSKPYHILSCQVRLARRLNQPEAWEMQKARTSEGVREQASGSLSDWKRSSREEMCLAYRNGVDIATWLGCRVVGWPIAASMSVVVDQFNTLL